MLSSFIYMVERPKGHNYSSVFVNATNTVCHLSSADDAVISAAAPGKATRLYRDEKLPKLSWNELKLRVQ